MFDFIRKHTKVTMALLFLLIVPSFILVGMNNTVKISRFWQAVTVTYPERAHIQLVPLKSGHFLNFHIIYVYIYCILYIYIYYLLNSISICFI